MTLVQEIVVLRSKFNAPAGDGNLLQGRSNLELEKGKSYDDRIIVKIDLQFWPGSHFEKKNIMSFTQP